MTAFLPPVSPTARRWLVLVVLLLGSVWRAPAQELPVLGDNSAHDPSTMIKEGSYYYVYRTGQNIPFKRSSDLRNWTDVGTVFPAGAPAWTAHDVPNFTGTFWAPDVVYVNGLYYLYYAVSTWGSQDSAIGVAVNPTLDPGSANYRWTDLGPVIESNPGATPYNCIDPCPFLDANGALWLVFGSYFNGIYITPLDPSTGKRSTVNTTITRLAFNGQSTLDGTEEASYMYRHNGYYYLFVNQGQCCDGIDSTYHIVVGRGSSATGPFYDRNGVNLLASGGTSFAESVGRFIGPGHVGITPDNGTEWFTHHYYDALASGMSRLGLTRLTWTSDNWPLPANDWSAFYPFNVDAREHLGLFNGTLQNGAAVVAEPGRGAALNLDGISQFVTVPAAVSNASTFAAWVKWNGGANWQRIFDFGASTSTNLFLTPSAGNGRLRFSISSDGSATVQNVDAPAALPIGSWCHVAITLDGTNGVLYLNGVPVATSAKVTTRPWEILARNCYLGKSQFTADPTFNGKLASFRVYSRALSAAEIQKLAYAHPALAHRYSFNGDASDSIGLANGTLMGNATVANGALSLPGTPGSYVNLPGGLVSGASAATLEFWGTFGVNGNWVRVFDFGDISGAVGQNYLFFTPHSPFNTLRMETKTTAGLFDADVPGTTLDQKTAHVVCIADPSQGYSATYLNGALASQSTGALPPLAGVSTAWGFLGRSLFSADAWLNASLNEVRIYDGRLTPEEIAADAATGPDALALPVHPQLTGSAGGMATLAWPSWAVGYAPEYSPTLGPGAIWTSLGVSPTLNNDQWSTTVYPNGTQGFYRLRR